MALLLNTVNFKFHAFDKKGTRDYRSTNPTSQKRMAPSDPPLANSVSWTGCQETATERRGWERGWRVLTMNTWSLHIQETQVMYIKIFQSLLTSKIIPEAG